MERYVKYTKTAFISIVLLIIEISLVFLFYNQGVTNNEKYPSDLKTHISSALDLNSDQYTITKPIYRFLYTYGGNIAIAIFLALMVLLTIYFTKKILDYVIEKKNDFTNWIYAIILNFEIAVYLPFIHNYFNLGLQESSEWHNSTFICMKAIGLLAVLMY